MILNNVHYQATNVWDVRNLKNVTGRKKMKPKQVIEQLQEIKQEIQEELDKWGDITKENGADPIPDIIDGQEKYIQALDHAINCVGAISLERRYGENLT